MAFGNLCQPVNGHHTKRQCLALANIKGVPRNLRPVRRQLWNALLIDAQSRHQLREPRQCYFPEYRDKLAAITARPSHFERRCFARRATRPRRVSTHHLKSMITAVRRAASASKSRRPVPREAAHIIPFGVSRNDKPDNGVALCPNHHWAMTVASSLRVRIPSIEQAFGASPKFGFPH